MARLGVAGSYDQHRHLFSLAPPDFPCSRAAPLETPRIRLRRREVREQQNRRGSVEAPASRHLHAGSSDFDPLDANCPGTLAQGEKALLNASFFNLRPPREFPCRGSYHGYDGSRGLSIGDVCLKGCGLSTGSAKKKVVPCPGCDSAHMRPRWACMIRRQIARPTPVPGYSSAVCKRLNGSKIADASLGSKPIPLSRIEMIHSDPFCSAAM